MTCDKNVPDKAPKRISQNMGQVLPHCPGLSVPQIRAGLWCPHLLSNLSWFSISQHPALQTGCSPGSPVWFYISTPFIIQRFWSLISPQSSSTDRLVQSPLLSFPVWRAFVFLLIVVFILKLFSVSGNASPLAEIQRFWVLWSTTTVVDNLNSFPPHKSEKWFYTILVLVCPSGKIHWRAKSES